MSEPQEGVPLRDAVLQQQTLFISAGHDDNDPGAIGYGNIKEADVVLSFRDDLAEYLRGKVVFAKDGERNQNLPLRTASKMASKHDIALEFHCNAFNGKATGVETLSQPDNYALGNRICQVISDTVGIANRGAKPEGSGQHSRLAFASAGGIIVELMFFDNRSDCDKFFANRDALIKALGDLLIEAVCE